MSGSLLESVSFNDIRSMVPKVALLPGFDVHLEGVSKSGDTIAMQAKDAGKDLAKLKKEEDKALGSKIAAKVDEVKGGIKFSRSAEKAGDVSQWYDKPESKLPEVAGVQRIASQMRSKFDAKRLPYMRRKMQLESIQAQPAQPKSLSEIALTPAMKRVEQVGSDVKELRKLLDDASLPEPVQRAVQQKLEDLAQNRNKPHGDHHRSLAVKSPSMQNARIKVAAPKPVRPKMWAGVLGMLAPAPM
jgi:hypothetical protein